MKVVFSPLPIITLTLSSLFIFLLLLIFFSNSYWTSKTSSSNSLYVIPNFSKNKLFNSSFTLFTCILSPIYNFYKFISEDEKRDIAKHILCFLYLLNKAHLKAYLIDKKAGDIQNVEDTIKKWLKDIPTNDKFES